jgi:acyl-CoA synthetase (AMP-forming)/AMP-acid ligase II
LIAAIVREAARRFRDKVAVVDADGDQLTYFDLFHRSEAIAGGLLESGVQAGDVVALALPSSLDYVVAYLGAARIGAISAGINPRLSPHERERVLARCAPKVVISDAADIPKGEPLRGKPPGRPDPERPVTVVFTSGTTGEPKGAVFRNRQLAAITMFDSGGAWGSRDEERPMLSSTEMCHVGFMTKLPWYLRTGSRIHVARGRCPPNDQRAAHAIGRRHRRADRADAPAAQLRRL